MKLLELKFLFKESELAEIIKRMQGDLSDSNGTWANRVKPKLLEILAVDQGEINALLTPQKRGRKKK